MNYLTFVRSFRACLVWCIWKVFMAFEFKIQWNPVFGKEKHWTLKSKNHKKIHKTSITPRNLKYHLIKFDYYYKMALIPRFSSPYSPRCHHHCSLSSAIMKSHLHLCISLYFPQSLPSSLSHTHTHTKNSRSLSLSSLFWPVDREILCSSQSKTISLFLANGVSPLFYWSLIGPVRLICVYSLEPKSRNPNFQNIIRYQPLWSLFFSHLSPALCRSTSFLSFSS